jgi:hypothetical protein
VHLVSQGEVTGFTALLDGVESTWDPKADGATPEQRLESVLAQALGQLLELLGVDASVLADGGVRSVMQTLQGADTALSAPLLDPAAMDRAWGGDLAHKVQRRAQARLAKELQAKGIDVDQLDPDSAEGRALLQRHAPAIVRVLFAAVVQATAPIDPGQDEVIPPPHPGVARWVQAALAHITQNPPAEA